jgi:uncharacterized protein (TIGR04255 family)
MQVSRRYLKAPITEALIDLKVTLPEEFSTDDLAHIYARVSDRFPTQESIQTGSLVFQAGPTIRIDTNQQHSGFLFRSKDGVKIVQATLNGFTFNRLAPYDSWEELSSDAKYLWGIYKEICKPTSVTRAAIRFINQINIPAKELVDLEDYLHTVPQVPPDLPQGVLNSFFTQLQIPQDDLNCMLIINEALVPRTSPDFISVILDFDLFRQQIWQVDDEDIWRFLEELRRRKNVVFEASITDKARRLFD